MAYGLTSLGFNRKTFSVLKQEIGDYWKAKISKKLDTDSEKSVASNQLHPVATSFAELWELAEAAANALDSKNVTGPQAIVLGSMVGISPNPEGPGYVNVELDIDAGTYAAGSLVAYVEGEPDNLWELDEELVTAGGADVAAVFRSQATGSDVRAPAGTLTVIAASVSGWNAINNPDDDGQGTDEETPAELMVRREIALASQGSTTVGSIKDAVLEVSGVDQVSVFTNRNSFIVNGIPGHSHRVVIWDGDTEEADNDDVAQAILGHQADGVRSYGAISGTATQDDGTETTEYFDRATTQRLYAAVEVESSGVDEPALKQAMSDYISGTLGERVVYSKLKAVVANFPGVDDVLALTLDTVDPPVGTVNILVSADTRANLLTTDVDVTVTAG